MNAIPTTYKGVRFRSRLEATWAAFFDELKWPWEYEPLDLAGYIPDFILPFDEGRRPLLVEVKPAMDLLTLEAHTAKIDASGWSQEALLVGARCFEDHINGNYYLGPVLGLLREVDTIDGQCWAEAQAMCCNQCKGPSLCHALWTFSCRVCGAYDGDHYQLPSGTRFSDAWAKAKNHAQWRGDRATK